MKSNETGTRALVLGGGGVAGVAWELGILAGLHDAGVDVQGADDRARCRIYNCYRHEPA